jgi:hypothetical protein
MAHRRRLLEQQLAAESLGFSKRTKFHRPKEDALREAEAWTHAYFFPDELKFRLFFQPPPPDRSRFTAPSRQFWCSG